MLHESPSEDGVPSASRAGAPQTWKETPWQVPCVSQTWMSATALVSEFSECELSDQGCTATHKSGGWAGSYPTTSCQLLWRSMLKDFGKGPEVTSPLQLSDGVRWGLSPAWVHLGWNEQVQESHKDSSTNSCVSTSPQSASQQACEGRTHPPWKPAEL